MSKDLGLSVVAGLASGLVFLSVFAGGGLGMLLMYITPLPLAMVGLSMGLPRLLVAAGVSVLVVAPLAWSATPVFALIAPLPALVISRQALLWRQTADGSAEWYPPGLLLSWLAVAAVVLMLLGAGVLAVQGGGVEASAANAVGDFVSQFAPDAPDDVKRGAVALWTRFFPAMLASAWLMMAVANGVVAQWTVNKAGRGMRPTPAYGEIALPRWLPVVLGAAGLLGALAGGDAGYIGRNAAMVLLWPFVFAGVAAVHAAVKGRQGAGLWLALFYVVFFTMFGWALLVVAGLGLVEHWWRPRRRRAGDGQEER